MFNDVAEMREEASFIILVRFPFIRPSKPCLFGGGMKLEHLHNVFKVASFLEPLPACKQEDDDFQSSLTSGDTRRGSTSNHPLENGFSFSFPISGSITILTIH